jgi:hypothetical protein
MAMDRSGRRLVVTRSSGGAGELRRWLSTVVCFVAEKEEGGWRRGIFGATTCDKQGPVARGGSPPGSGSWVHEDGGQRWSLTIVAAHVRAESRDERDGDGE